MKFAVETLDLGKTHGWTRNDGTPIYAVVPTGVTEGFAREMAALRGNDEEGKPKDDAGRKTNLIALDQVVDWNFDDDKGEPVPLTSSVHPGTKTGDERRLEILSKLPIALPGLVAAALSSTKPLSERAEAFSKTSSGSS